MNEPVRRRGQPLVWLGVLTLGWTGARSALWESPFAKVADLAPLLADRPAADGEPPRSAARAQPGIPPAGRLLARIGALSVSLAAERYPSGAPRLSMRPNMMAGAPSAPIIPPIGGPRSPAASMAGTEPSPPDDGPAQAGAEAMTMDGQPLARSRLHGDAWFVLRAGGVPGIAAPGQAAAYGGTQGGVVIRYDMALGDRRPQAYLRATHAPAARGQSELALGVSARPFGPVPVRLHAEARASRFGGSTGLRPAAFAVTELAPIALPGDLNAEAYVQAGWVGGRFATPFVDGQVRADRAIAHLGPAAVRAGAGVWGGAQSGAGRLDVGPSVMIDLRESPVPIRIAVDYRLRVAGNAVPPDGVAMTVSTGF